MYLLARLRRGIGVTCLSLLTATTLTVVWAVPAPVAAKPSKKKGEKLKKTETAENPAASEAEGDEPSAEVEPVAEPGEAEAKAEPAEPTAAELDAEARDAFDSGDFRTASERWTLALERSPEGKATHLNRSVMLLNAVNAYKQVYAESKDRKALIAGRSTIHAYMRACKGAYDLRCNGYPETDEARELLAEMTALINESDEGKLLRAPPEYNTALGGRPFDVSTRREPLPSWTLIATIGGVAVIGGGAYLFYWARTEPKFEATDDETAIARSAEDDVTGETGTEDDTGTTTTGSLASAALSDQAKGKLYTGLGISAMAIGVGFIVLGALGMRKHRRINRREKLAVTPSFGPGGGGVLVQGRF